MDGQSQDHYLSEVSSRKPTLAILTMDDELLLFRGNRSNFSDLIAAGEDQGFTVYVLTIKHLKFKQSRLTGFAYEKQSQTWQRRSFPFPDVIYNRIPQREDELLPTVRRKIAACIRHPRVHFYNPTFFNKWTLFRWLNKSRTTKGFTPATRKLLSQAGLAKMLGKHPFLYLKPASGKAGAGIMSIHIQPDNPLPYRLKIQENKKSATYKCATLGKLWSRIKKQSKNLDYIAQQGIDLATYNDRRFDLRALVQKNGRGQWDITGVGARVAGMNSITTHVPRGGSIDDPESLLASVFGKDTARRIMTKARHTSLLISRQIERASGHDLCEMSMDLGVDKQGNIWFFEANAKPMKFDEPHIRKRSLERIYQYSLYATKHKPKKRLAGGA